MNKKSKISPAVKWVFSIFILLIMIIATVFGSLFYLNPTLKQNNSTNKEIIGSKIVLKIQEDKFQSNSKGTLTPYQIAENVKKYLQEKGDKLTSNFDVNLLENNLIEVKSLNATNDDSKKQLINSLVNKPYLTITDHNGNPLFYKGRYQNSSAPSEKKGLNNLIEEGSKNFNMDLDPNPASDKIPQGYADRIQIKLNSYAWDQFTHLAYDYWIRGFQGQNQNPESPENKVYFWLNLDEFIANAIENDSENWEKAGKNPVRYAYVKNNPDKEITRDKDGNILSSVDPILKNSINAQRYLISSVSPVSLISSQKRDSIFYLINNSPNGYSNKQLTSLINFSYTPFVLDKEFSYFETKKAYKFDYYGILILISFAVMALFLVLKHRFLGIIASITMAFLIFVFLSILTAFGVMINSLIVLSTIIILFIAFNLLAKKLQIFNKEIREGSNTNKAINKATKKTFSFGLDVIATLAIASIVSFYLNINHSTTIGATIGVGAILIATIIIGLNPLIFKSIIQTEFFDNKKHLVHCSKTRVCKLSSKLDNLFKLKFFIIPLIIFAVVGLIAYSTFAIKDNSFVNGLNLGNNFKNNFIYSIGLDFKNNESRNSHILIMNDITEFITSSKNIGKDITIQNIKINEDGLNSLLIYSKNNINEFINNDLVNFFEEKNYANVELIKTSNLLKNTTALQTVGWNILLIFLVNISIAIYLSFRYSLQSSIIYVIKQFILITLIISFLAIFRTHIDVYMFAGILFATFINTIDHTLISSRIKSEIKKDINTKNFIYKEDQIRSIFKLIITDMISIQNFNMLFGVIMLLTAPFLLVNISFNTVVIISSSLMILWYLNLFVMPRIWERLLNNKYKNKLKRIQNNFWATEKIQEQVFIGINDFSM
ncbi:protein translocase subunit SecDF [Metamycoplasma gateae]|uniref:Peptide transporter n=1 Tax=Metamycoplasma gateae TaxID=35769 RepID=A0ABZ2AI54_9BACT|nr:peptide transporter [Metamycoplasma gateae]